MSTEMITTIITILIFLGITTALIMHLLTLKKNVGKLSHQIEVCKYFTEIAEIANDHVNEKHLKEVANNTEKALEKGRRIMGFSDKISGPLNTIIDDTEQIASGTLNEDERNRLSREVANSSNKLIGLVENVLLSTRIESDSLILYMQHHEVGAIIQDIYDQYKDEDGSLYREVEYLGPVKLGIIHGRPELMINCDKMQLKRAIEEVLKNSFKFTQSGDILIGWFYHLASNEVEIFIEDNGIGIAEESQQHVFDMFYKVDEKIFGAGVGLTLTEKLIKKMGGNIILKSRVGHGTRVSILFKLIRKRNE